VIFTDLRFAALVAVCWVLFFLAPRRFRPVVLAVCGVAFYASFAGQYLPLTLWLILGAYLLGTGRGPWALAIVVIVLFVKFKLGFDASGLSWPGPILSPRAALIVPLGFSFLVFELLHFVIERQRGHLADATFPWFAAFTLYFPARVAGPIKRYPQFAEAVAAASPSFANIYYGLLRILAGLVKKTVFADVLGLTAAELIYVETPAHAWRVVLAYSFQIYLDFSAYSDIAIGVSRVFGITIPENFRWPYLSPSVQEFWNRWHISLSSWARDYVFTPLGHVLFKTRLRRSAATIAAVSYLVTFLLIGAWHGLTATFLVWGLYHGLLLTAYYIYRKRVPRAVASSRFYASRPAHAAGVALTFVLVTIGWVPFMSTDLTRSLKLLKALLGL
jgi:alginate O-acetyltransferase complex protein AlgI